jgi:hypothetical protein
MDRSPSVPAAVEVDRRFQKPVVPRRLGLLGLLLLLAAWTFAAPAPAPTATPAVSLASVPALAASDLQGLSREALRAALDAVACARAHGVSGRDDLLTLIDYSLPSTAPRLWVLDLAHGKVLFHELVAHGQGSGENRATRFSNAEGSLETSLGLFKTAGTYEGKNGYSLQLLGLDPGINDLALERKIVMHGAWYVSPEQIRRYGRLGRSWGCPALSPASAHPVIDTIKGGSFIFAYAADPAWRQAASTRSCTPGMPGANAVAALSAVH